MSNSLRKSRRNNIVFHVILILSIIVILFPVYWMVKTSLINEYRIYQYPPGLFIEQADLDLLRYVRLLKESPLMDWVFNTFYLAVLTSLFGIIVSLPAAYALSRYPSKKSKYLGYSLLITRMLPLTLLIVPMYMILGRINLLNHHLSILLSNLAYILPFTIWTLKSFIDSIPRGIDESASIDGCSLLMVFKSIIFPLTMPGIGAVIVYSFVRIWGEFLFASSFLSSPELLTITVGAQLYAGSLNISWGNIMAVTTIGSAPMILIFLYLEKYYVSGLSAGAVKD